MNPSAIKTFALSFGAFLGLTAVMAGAMGAHALKEVLEPDQLASFQTAVRYQMYHALFLLLLGWNGAELHRLGRLSIAFVSAGVLLFSGSIYLLVLTEAPRWLGPITPIGGSLLIIGWGLLLVLALRRKT
jgi:uncharacterized membrane protein YgdD (TMEM256/DUF423 family)